MKTSNSGRILMTPGVTVAPFSEAMPAHPQNGDEVIAVNVGSSTYTLTGSITDGNLVMDAGESAILVWIGSTWKATWSSGSGGVTYPITAERGGTGADNSGADDGDVLAFDDASGTFLPIPVLNVGVTLPLGADLGGTGADLSALDAGQLIAFDGSVFAGVGLAAVSTAPGDTATSTLFWSATDSGANTFNVSAGIELPNSVGLAGDLVVRTGGSGASGSGTRQVSVSGVDGLLTVGTAAGEIGSVSIGPTAAGSLFGMTANKITDDTTNFSKLNVALDAFTSQAWMSIGEAGTGIGSTRQMWVGWEDDDIGPYMTLNTDPDFPGDASINFHLTSAAGAAEVLFNSAGFAPNVANLDLGANGLGLTGLPWATIWGGAGHAATALIGSGTDGTVNLVADAPGIAGNEFTVEVVAGIGLNVPMSAAFVLQALTVTLGTDGAGALDPAKNTATLVAGAINTAAGGVTATASGTGADPLTGAEGPTTFSGGAESLTLTGGLSANANIYLTNLPASDPGIAGALYQTAGAVMVSL